MTCCFVSDLCQQKNWSLFPVYPRIWWNLVLILSIQQDFSEFIYSRWHYFLSGVPQGSENETIVYVVGDSWAQRWKHIYTAVTRGQKRVYVVSKEEAIASAIKRHEIPRNTRLGGLVKEQLVQPWMLVGTPQAQPNTPSGTPTGYTPQQSTPLRIQTPGRPSSSSFRSTPFQPKRLWKADGDEEEAAESSVVDNVCSLSALNSSSDLLAEQLVACEVMEGDKEQDSAATSAGHKRRRMLSAEHEEVPCKQPQASCCWCVSHSTEANLLSGLFSYLIISSSVQFKWWMTAL